jgi:hypothetical protein
MLKHLLLALCAMTVLGLACNRATDPPPTDQPAQASTSQASTELGATIVLQAPAAEPILDQAPTTAVAPFVAAQPAPPAVQPPSTEVEPPDPSTTAPAPANVPADSSAASGPTAFNPWARVLLWRNATPMRC